VVETDRGNLEEIGGLVCANLLAKSGLRVLLVARAGRLRVALHRHARLDVVVTAAGISGRSGPL